MQKQEIFGALQKHSYEALAESDRVTVSHRVKFYESFRNESNLKLAGLGENRLPLVTILNAVR